MLTRKKRFFLLFSIYLNYFIFGLLLNSVGVVILKAQNFYNVDETEASTLEFFKDFSIAFFSFISTYLLSKLGHRKGMIMAMGAVILGCLSMASSLGNHLWMPKILFATIGASFALTKISIYSVLGLMSDDKKTHHKLMSATEGVFMLGIAAAYFLFPLFNQEAKVDSWLGIYWVLGALSAVALISLLLSENLKSEKNSDSVKDHFLVMFELLKKTPVILFALSAFFLVMTEQSFMTWLPTFNNKILNLNENLAITMTSILALSSGVGRISIGGLTKYWSWLKIVSFCLVCAMLLILFILSKLGSAQGGKIDHTANIPWIAYIFPTVGLFIAPVYPLMNSAMLTSLSKSLHGSMSGLIIIFSAIGGVLGSRITGYLFRESNGSIAFYYTLIPIGLLLTSLFFLYKKSFQKHD